MFKQLTSRIPTIDITLFFRQLAALMTAGIPIVQSCEILIHSQKSQPLRLLIITLKRNMEAGNELSRSLAKFPRYFDTFTCHLIQTGEQTGSLPAMLDRIALQQEHKHATKNKIKQALFYPIIVLLVASIVSIIMLTMVIPRFAELFQSMHSSLPAFTRFIIELSTWVHRYYWTALFPLSAMPLLPYYAHHSVTFRCRIENLLLKAPILGTLYTKIILSRFCRTLSITFTAGIPISESLKAIAYTNGSDLFAQAILKLQLQIQKGQQLHRAMQHQQLFPSLLVQMVKIGEESGMLDKMLEKVAALYQADIDYFMSKLGRTIEPLIITILGALIGGLVIAMYLPIFKLGTVL